jgi:periplasmic protein TonB
MPRDLFGDVVHPPAGISDRKWYSLPLSILVHALVIAVAVIVPLVAADALPTPPAVVEYILATAPPPPPPPPAPPSAAARARPLLTSNQAAAPTEAPTGIKTDFGPEPELSSGAGVEGGLPDGVAGSGIVTLTEPPPPPPAAPMAPYRVSQGIRQPAKIRDVQPAYPTIAQSARVQGVVILEAIIGVDGRVQEARVLRSIPLLDQAALAAVRQWVYTPTLLNGVPVPIVMTVTVTFVIR